MTTANPNIKESDIVIFVRVTTGVLCFGIFIILTMVWLLTPLFYPTGYRMIVFVVIGASCVSLILSAYQISRAVTELLRAIDRAIT